MNLDKMDLQRWVNMRNHSKREMSDNVKSVHNRVCDDLEEVFLAKNKNGKKIACVVFDTAFELYSSSIHEEIDFDIKRTFGCLLEGNVPPWLINFLPDICDLLKKKDFNHLIDFLLEDTVFHEELSEELREKWNLLQEDINAQRLTQYVIDLIKVNSNWDYWGDYMKYWNKEYDASDVLVQQWDVVRELLTNDAWLVINNHWEDKKIIPFKCDIWDHMWKIQWMQNSYQCFNNWWILMMYTTKGIEIAPEVNILAWDLKINLQIKPKVIQWKEYILYIGDIFLELDDKREDMLISLKSNEKNHWLEEWYYVIHDGTLYLDKDKYSVNSDEIKKELNPTMVKMLSNVDNCENIFCLDDNWELSIYDKINHTHKLTATFTGNWLTKDSLSELLLI